MSAKRWKSTIIYGLSITVAVIGITAYGHLVLQLSSKIINNMAFYTLVLAQLLNVFNMAESKVSFFNNEIVKNPWVWSAIIISLVITISVYYIPPVSKALFLTSLSLEQIVWIIVFAFGSLALSQIFKRLGFAL